MRDVVEIGMGRTARRTYELDDINIVPSRRTRSSKMCPRRGSSTPTGSRSRWCRTPPTHWRHRSSRSSWADRADWESSTERA